MPWKETCTMKERELFINAWLESRGRFPFILSVIVQKGSVSFTRIWWMKDQIDFDGMSCLYLR